MPSYCWKTPTASKPTETTDGHPKVRYTYTRQVATHQRKSRETRPLLSAEGRLNGVGVWCTAQVVVPKPVGVDGVVYRRKRRRTTLRVVATNARRASSRERAHAPVREPVALVRYICCLWGRAAIRQYCVFTY